MRAERRPSFQLFRAKPRERRRWKRSIAVKGFAA
jgi:hypothetical protein